MKYTTLMETSPSREMIDTFLGYNHNLRISENEFFDMKNMTSSHYPVLSPRGKRGVYEYPSSGAEHSPNGMIAKDSFCYVDGVTLYINNNPVEGLVLTDTPKQLISMGAYIIIMPDKKYINTVDYDDKGSIEASYTSSGTVSYELCTVDGDAYTDISVSESEPSNPSNMELWIDTSTSPHTLKQYSASSSMWTSVATTYVKIKSPGIASAFKEYDAVKISGITIQQLKDLEGQVSVLWSVHQDEEGNGADDYISVVGILDNASTQTDPITVSRSMPALDFIVEANNRLWGCRYGTDNDGNVVNEIYASKLGDFKNWDCYMGLSTDSYRASCGTDGQWTGAITYLGYPLFFKENFLHKVYGNYPANFQIQSTACRGVQRGCGKSLAIVNETLFYKSRSGVCAYDGSLPGEISSALGEVRYTALDESTEDVLRSGAVSGSLGNKYYISMKSEVDGNWYLFAYDTAKNMWHKEDNTRVDDFCECDGELYFIDHSDKKIKTINGSGIEESEEVSWMAETGILGTSMPDKKYISRLLIRMSMSLGSTAKFYAQYDSSGEWVELCSITGNTLRSFSIPLRPKRCDHFRLRIVGTGEAKIFSITKTIEQGSDV